MASQIMEGRRSGARAIDVARVVCSLTVSAEMLACRPSDVLSVPPPAGVTVSSAYQSQSGVEALANTGKAGVFQGFAQADSGLLEWSGLLSDEFTWRFFAFQGAMANIDARITTGTAGFAESGDAALGALLGARVTLVTAVDGLKKYEPPSGRAKIGEAYALTGYTEVLLAEDYCAGVPLGRLVAGVGVQFGAPLTTDSLLSAAEADFDSATAYTGGDATVAALAAIGLARARLDRGHYAQAAAAVSAVPTSFVYAATLEPGSSGAPNAFNFYDFQAQVYACGLANIGDHKGGNGLNYVSAQDPRLTLSTTVAETCDGVYGGSADSVWYYPMKFGNPSMAVPLATGVEARLVEAEAALQAGNVGPWANGLNALRADSADTKVVFQTLLPPDSTTTASAAEQVDVMFRERAFWLFGTATRLGDMRRLVRQYGRDQGAVFPAGPYPNAHNPGLPVPLPNYGTDVNLTLPTPASGTTTPNPNYKGCLTSTKVA
jgi:hypothetical protein